MGTLGCGTLGSCCLSWRREHAGGKKRGNGSAAEGGLQVSNVLIGHLGVMMPVLFWRREGVVGTCGISARQWDMRLRGPGTKQTDWMGVCVNPDGC